MVLGTLLSVAVCALSLTVAPSGAALAQSSRDETGSSGIRSKAIDRKPAREEPNDAASDAPAPRKISRGRDAASTDASGKPRPVGSGYGVLGPLALVLFVALFVAALWKRHGPGLTPGLPREAVDVLGRRPLDPRTTLWLVRLGSRILVLGVTPGGVQSLTEVNNPAEVDLLTGLCKRRGPGDTPVESFQMLFGQLATGPKSAVDAPASIVDDEEFGGSVEQVAGRDPRPVDDARAGRMTTPERDGGPAAELFARRFQRSTAARDAEEIHGT